MDEEKNLIDRFEQFFQINYEEEILRKASVDEEFLLIEFSELSMFDLMLAEELLENPEETIKAAQYALERFDTSGSNKLTPRFANLPASTHLPIREARSKHLDRLHEFKGIVKQKNDVRPQLIAATFQCPRCQTKQVLQQNEKKLKTPRKCGECGWKGSFNLIKKNLQDVQKMVLEEAPEELTGGEQPKRINVFLKDDLVSPISDKKTNPGSKIAVSGILKEVPVNLSTGAKSTQFDLIIEGNYVKPVQEQFSELDIDKEERDELIQASKDPKIWDKLVESMAPSIYGHDKIKEALTLQLFGGCRKSQADGVNRRGDIHILLIGDPGAGKCVTGDTVITLENGETTEISTLAKRHDVIDSKQISPIGTPSLGLDGKMNSSNSIRIWRREPEKQLFKIKTGTGKTLKVSQDHPLFTTQDGVIFAKEAQTLSEGDRIAIPRKIEYTGETQFLEPQKEKYYRNSREYSFPSQITPTFSSFLGFLVGDGYITETDSSARISFSNRDSALLQKYTKQFKNLFGETPTQRKTKGNHEIYVLSKGIHSFLKENVKEVVGTSKTKRVPQKIKKSPKPCLKEFLQSLFDCDAHVNKKRNHIEYTTISKDLAKDVENLLLRFGIITRSKTKTKYATNTTRKRKVKAYELIIPPDFVDTYYTKIGFSNTDKAKTLHEVYNRNSNSKTNTDTIPGLQFFLKQIRLELGLTQKDMGIPRSSYAHYEQGNREPSRKTLQKICATLSKYDSKNVEILSSLAHSDVFWDKIVEIDTVQAKGYLYDLEVAHTHNYVANGVVVHNSQLLKRMSHVAPKSRFVSGKGASGAGLTASVVKDEFLKGWALEAGALVLANKGLACIDELDKMSQEDASAMHEALEQQSITISKANIQATLKSQTTVLAAANPKYGRFDPYEVLAKQIEMPSTLINRFDLIFPIRDVPDKDKDNKLASFILNLHKDEKKKEVPFDTDFLKRYVAFAKQRVDPALSKPALKEIRDYFIKMRNSSKSDDKIQSIPISARQLEGLVRLAEASAKTRFSSTVERRDAERAVDLLHHCLTQIGYDQETGEFDIDRITTGVTASQRSQISIIKEIITTLEEEIGTLIPVEDIVQEAEAQDIPEEKTDKIIMKLKQGGDIYSPKSGYISRI